MEEASQSELEEQDDLSAYAGRWIAVLHGRVVAVAETAEQARTGARLACPRENALLLRVPAGGIRTAP